MNTIKVENLPELFQGVSDIFAEKKEELCEMDANMGDGDLGLTMNKGYGALPQLLRENAEEGNVGKTLMKAGMKMAGIVPSTMGTLMASGIMQGGKALNGKSEMAEEELAAFLCGFAEGIQKRGKCQLGDRTILDAVDAAAACRGAAQGVEATKNMIPKFGKAAVFSAKAIGIADQGAVAGMYLMQGLARYFES